jgi:hypothetical protein
VPLTRTTLSRDQLETSILVKSSINPFEQEIKPELTQKPAFNYCECLSDHFLRLEFVYAGKSYEVEDNLVLAADVGQIDSALLFRFSLQGYPSRQRTFNCPGKHLYEKYGGAFPDLSNVFGTSRSSL